MPYNPTLSKTIQIRQATDKKLAQVIRLVEKQLNIKLKSRDQAIDMLASRFISDNPKGL